MTRCAPPRALRVAPSARCSVGSLAVGITRARQCRALSSAVDVCLPHLRQADDLEAEDEKEGDAATGAAKPEGGGKGKGRGKGEGGGKGKGGRGGGERRNEFAANRPKRNDKGVGGKPEKGGSKSTGSKAAVRPARPHHLSLPPRSSSARNLALGPLSPSPLCDRGGPATTHRSCLPCPFARRAVGGRRPRRRHARRHHRVVRGGACGPGGSGKGVWRWPHGRSRPLDALARPAAAARGLPCSARRGGSRKGARRLFEPGRVSRRSAGNKCMMSLLSPSRFVW